MKLGKLLLAVMTATALFGALVASASARNLELSSLTKRAVWTRVNIAGGFGTIECELVLELRFHTRTFTKTLNSLIGYIIAGNVPRCARGGATINRGSLPWHDRYLDFGGRLPDILFFDKIVTGAEWTLREPTFGITCTVRREASSLTINYPLSGGVVTSSILSGRGNCGGIEGEVSGTTTNITDGTGARITIRLI